MLDRAGCKWDCTTPPAPSAIPAPSSFHGLLCMQSTGLGRYPMDVPAPPAFPASQSGHIKPPWAAVHADYWARLAKIVEQASPGRKEDFSAEAGILSKASSGIFSQQATVAKGGMPDPVLFLIRFTDTQFHWSVHRTPLLTWLATGLGCMGTTGMGTPGP